MCFTFNYNGTVKWAPGGFIYPNGNHTTIKARAAGLSTALRLRLHARDSEYCYSNAAPFQGFQVAIHSVNQLTSSVNENSALVSPGFRTQIRVWEEIHDARNVENLGRCSSQQTLSLYSHLPYTKPNCIDECLAEIIWRECKCTWMALPIDLLAATQYFYNNVAPYPPNERNTANIPELRNGTSVCYGNATGVACQNRIRNAYQVDEMFGNCSTKDRCPDSCFIPEYYWTIRNAYQVDEMFGNCSTKDSCPDSCFIPEYYWTSTATRYPPENLLPVLMEETGVTSKEEFVNNIAEVDIMLATLEQTFVIESRAMSAAALFNSLGGSLGLFLGISLFTFVELSVMCLALFCGVTPDKDGTSPLPIIRTKF